MINWDDEIPKDLSLSFVQSKYEHAPKWPHRGLLVGPSRSGKSNICTQLILDVLRYDKLYYFCRDVTEDKLLFIKQWFQDVCDALEKET
eukprot:11981688-Ditylum_brightwellii.AAC.1